MFDSTIGASSVTLPYGGKYQMTPVQTMVAKLPVLHGKTNTVTMMSYGFDPYLSKWSPFHGAVYAITHSIAKIVAAGGDYKKIRLTFRYFKRREDRAMGTAIRSTARCIPCTDWIRTCINRRKGQYVRNLQRH